MVTLLRACSVTNPVRHSFRLRPMNITELHINKIINNYNNTISLMNSTGLAERQPITVEKQAGSWLSLKGSQQ